ncbi:hypothetical protein D9M72_340900 [compost metagenome]
MRGDADVDLIAAVLCNELGGEDIQGAGRIAGDIVGDGDATAHGGDGQIRRSLDCKKLVVQRQPFGVGRLSPVRREVAQSERDHPCRKPRTLADRFVGKLVQCYEVGPRLFTGQFIEHCEHIGVGDEGFLQRVSGLLVRREVVAQDRRVVALSHNPLHKAPLLCFQGSAQF